MVYVRSAADSKPLHYQSMGFADQHVEKGAIIDRCLWLSSIHTGSQGLLVEYNEVLPDWHLFGWTTNQEIIYAATIALTSSENSSLEPIFQLAFEGQWAFGPNSAKLAKVIGTEAVLSDFLERLKQAEPNKKEDFATLPISLNEEGMFSIPVESIPSPLVTRVFNEYVTMIIAGKFPENLFKRPDSPKLTTSENPTPGTS